MFGNRWGISMRTWLLGVVVALWSVGVGPANAQIGLGLIAAPADRYNQIQEALPPFSGGALPPRVDLSERFPPPGDQANQNSCVGWAVAYALKSYQEAVERDWSLVGPGGTANHNRVFSPSFIYNQINRGQDAGSTFGDAFRIMMLQGAAPLSAMPYTASPFVPVSPAAVASAGEFRIDTFRTVAFRDRAEMKTQLFNGFPIVFAAHVDQAFQAWQGAGVMNAAGGGYLGRHAMVVVGYDDARGAYRVMNSWGRGWGDGGYAWIAYSLFERIVTEAYLVFDQQGFTPSREDVLANDVWTPPAIPAEQSQLVVDGWDPNYIDPFLGVGLRLTGLVSIPPGVRGDAQVVVSLRFSQTGQVVSSRDPRFQLPSGQAAGGTPPLRLSGQGLTERWYAFIRYCSLDLPMGTVCVHSPTGMLFTSNLVAEPTLYVDRFGVARGQPLLFFVNL
jgi:hypothetical protein